MAGCVYNSKRKAANPKWQPGQSFGSTILDSVTMDEDTIRWYARRKQMPVCHEE